MRFRLLTFDWDGTLMDSAGRIVSSMEAAVRDAGLPPLGEARIREIIGLGLEEAVARLFPGLDRETLEGVMARYRHHYLVADATPEVLFPGVRETLEALKGEGYLLAVATGKSRRGLERSLRATGLEGFFHATRCAGEAPSKPHPGMLLDIMAALGVSPSRTLMVGDTEYDLQMARAAGAQALGVCYGAHPPARLWAQRPLGCLEGIAELPAWLKRPG